MYARPTLEAFLDILRVMSVCVYVCVCVCVCGLFHKGPVMAGFTKIEWGPFGGAFLLVEKLGVGDGVGTRCACTVLVSYFWSGCFVIKVLSQNLSVSGFTHMCVFVWYILRYQMSIYSLLLFWYCNMNCPILQGFSFSIQKLFQS